MNRFVGDVWDYPCVVVPVNLTTKRVDGETVAVMGAGLALQAAKRYPAIPRQLGRYYAQGQCQMRLFEIVGGHCVITVPTKVAPSQRSDKNYVCEQIERLHNFIHDYAARGGETPVAIPLLGCGLGKLHPYNILPTLDRLNWRNREGRELAVLVVTQLENFRYSLVDTSGA